MVPDPTEVRDAMNRVLAATTEARKAVETSTSTSAAAIQAATDAAHVTRTALGAIDAMRGELTSVREDVAALRNDFAELVKSVHGKSDPPPPVDGAPPLAAVAAGALAKAEQADARASSATLEQASFEGRVLAELARVQAELGKQSGAMGLGVRGVKWLVSTKDGRATAMRAATLAVVIYETLRHSIGH